MVSFGGELLTAAIAGAESSRRPCGVAELPARSARPAGWPDWAEPGVIRAFVDHGVETPWSHQVAAADLAHAGQHVVISTGTASGKSLAFQLPIMDALARDPRPGVVPVPTKALGHDQLRTAHALTAAVLPDVAPTSYDGDTPAEVRRFAGNARGGCSPTRT